MSFNISPSIIIPIPTERTPKFPKVGSKMSVATQADCFLETQISARKITKDQKERFIDLITNQNVNMKVASRQVGMSYSTAKKVFSRFRKTLKLRNSNRVIKIQNGLQCSYAEVPLSEVYSVPQMTVISTIAGRQQLKFSKD